MNVKELIKQLKKYPDDFLVGVAMHDNLEGEIAGWVQSIIEYDRDAPSDLPPEPEGVEAIVLHC